jgi:hypothetical protein
MSGHLVAAELDFDGGGDRRSARTGTDQEMPDEAAIATGPTGPSEPVIQILLIEDDAGDAYLVQDMFAESGVASPAGGSPTWPAGSARFDEDRIQPHDEGSSPQPVKGS